MNTDTKPSAGAMKAAETITRRLQQGSLSPAWTNTIARIIDDNGMREMAEALERCLSRDFDCGDDELSPEKAEAIRTAGRAALARYHGKGAK
jgi:hypothetical protein